MNNIYFDNGHKERFECAMAKTGHAMDNSEYSSCLYILTSDIMYKHLDDCFDFKDNCIKPEAFLQPWQTGSTYGLTCLAFNLFTEATPTPSDVDDKKRQYIIERYATARVFWSLDRHNTKIALFGIMIHEGLVKGGTIIWDE